MTAPDETTPSHLELPLLLRRAASHSPAGPDRDALLHLAGELETGGDPALISHATLRAALKTYRSPERLPDTGDRVCACNATALNLAEPMHVSLPPILRREAERRPDGPKRSALLRYADELEAMGDADLVSPATFRAAWAAFGGGDDHPDVTEPVYVRRAAYLRREADHHPSGPDRDALLRYADELEESGETDLVSPATVRAALKAFGSPERLPDVEYRICTCTVTEPAVDEPPHIRMPPILRRRANDLSAGPNRDALLRFAGELEEKGDATLVSHATSRAALVAFGAEDDYADDF